MKTAINLKLAAFAILIAGLSFTGCSKDEDNSPSASNIGQGNNSGNTTSSFDERIIGRWQNQEFLGGGGGATQVFVTEITLAEDGRGFEDTYSIGDAGQTQPQRTNFNWFGLPNNILRITLSNSTVAEVSYVLTTDGTGMRLTQADGRNTIFTRMN